jgi:hypothetical protein
MNSTLAFSEFDIGIAACVRGADRNELHDLAVHANADRSTSNT